jgi:hypothetical protein
VSSSGLNLTTIYFLFLLITIIGISSLTGQTILVDTGAEWKYLDDGSDQDISWHNPTFNDSGWATGTAQLGYGDGDEATVISYGSDPENKYITYYFRHSFNIDDTSRYLGLTLELLRDDGAVVYLNGIEIERSNMPADTINYLTLASSSVSSNEDTFIETFEDPGNLVSGTNVLAVEVHQAEITSSDISFDLRLITGTEFPDVARKAPYLIYNGNNTEMQVLWQLYVSQTCTIEWGTDSNYLLGSVQTNEYGDDHQHTYTIPNLIPDTKYYYRVTVNQIYYASSFRSAPDSTDKSIKFFVYGDSRSYPDIHNNVAGGIVDTYHGNEDFQTLLISAGDLSNDGNQESDWDELLFSPLYPNIQEILASLPFQSCMGNHEEDGILFAKYFPYPFAGGRYWSFDYGLAHFVIVDQYTSYDPGSAQLAWIENDLASRSRAWNFILLHEPGWSAGNHSNDSDVQNYIQPLCEQYNVQVVFSGHNHYYAHAVVNNVHHVTTGGGGSSLHDPDPGSPNIVATAKTYHFCKVEIDGRHLSITAVDTVGNIIDSFSIEDPSLLVELITVPSDTLNFEEVLVGFQDTLEINVINTGYDVLYVSDISVSGEGFIVISDTFHLEIGESKIIPIIFEPLAEQAYAGIFNLASNDTNNPTVVLDILGIGVLPPDISVTPDSLFENLVTGDTSHQVLTISNQGSRDLLFDILQGAPSPIDSTAPSWYFIDRLSGNIPAGSTTDLSITFDATGLMKGDYESDFIILSNDPDEPELHIPLRLLVSGFPAISISDTLLSFEYVSIGDSVTDTLIVSNVGTEPLTLNALAIDNPVFKTDTTSMNLLPGENYPLFVTFNADTFGLSLATLTIISNDPAKPSVVTDLAGEGVFPPDIVVTPDSLVQNLVIGDTAHQELTIFNQGSKELVFDISPGVLSRPDSASHIIRWFKIDTLAGSVPPGSKTDLSLTFDANGLTAGHYETDIIILSNDPHNPELNIPVQLFVSGFPGISISDSLLSFENASVGFPLTDTLVVSNEGIAQLNINTISVNHPVFKTDTTSLSLFHGESYPLLVTFTADTFGLSLAALSIRSNDPDKPLLTVALRGEVLIPPAIIVSHLSFRDSLETGQNIKEILKIKNTGGSLLIFNISNNSGNYALNLNDSADPVHSTSQSWLTASPDSGTISAGDSLEIEISVTATGLSTGEFEGEILISCNDPNNREIIIPVYIKVTPTGIEDHFSTKIPKTYKLYQNYPNPFNPVTHIRFGLPKQSDVKIEIYNTIGQVIKILLDKPMPAGYHQIEFNSQNLPSGIYFYRIEAGKFQNVMKMIVIK